MTTTALESGGICDITTIGARSGNPRRIEIYFHHIDGEWYLTGKPGFPRDWLANLKANPEFTLHLRDDTDVTATASEITDPAERDRVLMAIRTQSWDVPEDKARDTNHIWVEQSPLVRFVPV